MDLESIKDKVLGGGKVTREEAEWLAWYENLDALCDAANEITRVKHGNRVDSCSIVNARSGLCGEDCKWCAQVKKLNLGCEVYDFLDEESTLKAAKRNCKEGIRRFSLVTSGRSVGKKDLEKFCKTIRRIKDETDLHVCASMGLLDEERMQMLKDAGVERYHCNMETSEKVFGRLCSTHTPADKRKTIAAARKAGLSVCSGGIIGMGETMKDRIDFAFELADLDIVSVPINILNAIPGTALEHQEPLPVDEIIRTVAVFRFILPDKALRFAGGRKRLSHDSQVRIMKGGMNGVLMGDMLTTVSNTIADDRVLFEETGFEF